MLLLFASFSFSLGLYFLIEKLRELTTSAKNLHQVNTNATFADCCLETVNLEIHSWTWISTFPKVYIIGVVETIYIVLCKRGLFSASTTRVLNEQHVDDLVKQYVSSSNQAAAPEVAVITGGDSGIGLEITRGLLEAGFHVIIGIHSPSSSEGVLNALQKSTGSDKVSCIPLDLTSFESVHEFVNQVKERVPKMNIQLLINNAGIMNAPYKMTWDGFESQCQTNFLSPILLTRSLLPYMSQKTGRVLFASSSTMYTIADLDLKTPLKKYGMDGLGHYAYSKACIAQLVPRLAKTTPVQIHAYHPGTVRTKLFSTTTVFNLPFLSILFDFIMLTPKEGSQTALYLCLTQELKSNTGTYWANERQQTLPSVFVNKKENDVEALWIDTMMKLKLKRKNNNYK